MTPLTILIIVAIIVLAVWLVSRMELTDPGWISARRIFIIIVVALVAIWLLYELFTNQRLITR